MKAALSQTASVKATLQMEPSQIAAVFNGNALVRGAVIITCFEGVGRQYITIQYPERDQTIPRSR